MPWWFVIILLVRDGLLAATLPVLRSRGLSALPVTYIGKAATFALMAGFPLVLLGTWNALWSRVVGACGWAFLGLGYVCLSVGVRAVCGADDVGGAPDAQAQTRYPSAGHRTGG